MIKLLDLNHKQSMYLIYDFINENEMKKIQMKSLLCKQNYLLVEDNPHRFCKKMVFSSLNMYSIELIVINNLV